MVTDRQARRLMELLERVESGIGRGEGGSDHSLYVDPQYPDV